MNTYLWLIRREFWENRAILWMPAALGAVLVLGALFGRIDIVSPIVAPEAGPPGGLLLFGFGMIFFAVMSVYSTWYLLDCLYAERRDRSVLFWKSLPIADSASVLAKLYTGLIAIPLVYFAAADLTTLLIAFVVSVRARASSGILWQPGMWLQLQALWLYLIATTAIWYLPVTGWLMLVSAWATRAVTLWSVLPPMAAYLLEREFFPTHFVGAALGDRIWGYLPRAFHGINQPGGWAAAVIGRDNAALRGSVWQVLDPIGFMSSPATWTGALVGACLVACAIQLRRRRTEL